MKKSRDDDPYYQAEYANKWIVFRMCMLLFLMPFFVIAVLFLGKKVGAIAIVLYCIGIYAIPHIIERKHDG